MDVVNTMESSILSLMNARAATRAVQKAPKAITVSAYLPTSNDKVLHQQ